MNAQIPPADFTQYTNLLYSDVCVYPGVFSVFLAFSPIFPSVLVYFALIPPASGSVCVHVRLSFCSLSVF